MIQLSQIEKRLTTATIKNEMRTIKMSKREKIVVALLDGYHEYTRHSGGVFQLDYIKSLIESNLIRRGNKGYVFYINEFYSVSVSYLADKKSSNSYELFEIGSFLNAGVWRCAGRMQRIEKRI